tara:strand:+ start:2479 stop:2769 length:291 start_codon:yes stop_codon:yes gene_type:complete
MFAVLALIAIDLYILKNTGVVQKEITVEEKTEDKPVEWTVYGTSWCGWTTKQLEYLKKKGIPHKFIDCEKDNCDGINAFPVMESSSGEKVKGYKEV